MSRIYFDYSTMATFSGYPTGIPRSVCELAKAFKRNQDNIGFIALPKNKQEFFNYDLELNKLCKAADFRKGDILFSPSAGWAFENYNMIVEKNIRKGIKYSQLYYDLIPYLFPHFYEDSGFGNHYYHWIDQNIKLCSNSFFISNSTKNDILKHCTVSSQHIPMQVIRLGDFIPSEEGPKDKIPTEIKQLNQFVLSVGTLEIRKNHEILLNAYRFLVKKRFDSLPTLVIAGREGWINNHLIYQIHKDPALKNRVIVLNNVSNWLLDYLYKHCMFTVYPSLYEGWGLPVAESLKYGKQCISSNSASLLEIAPKLTRFAHPLKLNEWVTQMCELLNDKKILAAESSRIKKEYKTITWDNTAGQILEALRKSL